jgi:hypothetical protein
VFFRHTDSASWQSPAANQSSNRIGAKFPYVTVIPFDLLNESFDTRGVARAELERYLESLENADYLYFYILTLEGRPYIVHGLPEDTDDIAGSRTVDSPYPADHGSLHECRDKSKAGRY